MSLSAENVSLKLGTSRVLTGVSIEVAAGTVCALVGPSGAGKSSLLRVLSGELSPVEGRVRMNGRPLQRWSVDELARRRSVMVQPSTMVFDFHVEEVLAMGWMRNGGRGFKAARKKVVKACRIGHLTGRRFNTLSSGERQRVQFARALLQIWRRRGSALPTDGGKARFERRYLLMDEPTSNLDMAHVRLVLRQVRRAGRGNVGVLIVLHDLNLAARVAERVTLLAGGAVAATGSPAEVFTDSTLSSVHGTREEVETCPLLGRLLVRAE